MVAGPLGLTGLGQRPAEAEVGVVVDLVGVEDRLELGGGSGEAATAEVGAAERLAHRGLLRSATRRRLQRLGGLLEIGLLEQLDPPPVKHEGRLALANGHAPSVETPVGVKRLVLFARRGRRTADRLSSEKVKWNPSRGLYLARTAAIVSRSVSRASWWGIQCSLRRAREVSIRTGRRTASIQAASGGRKER